MSFRQQLASLLARELTSLQGLHELLDQEYTALVNADVGALEQITPKKNQALAEQAVLTQSRRDFAAQSAAGAGATLEQLIASVDNPEELSTALARLTALARQCQEANRTNGRLILQKQQQARGALEIIRQTENSSPTYSGLGKTTETQDSRSLGKA